MKVLAIHLQNFLEYAELRGVGRIEILQKLKVDPDWLSNPTSLVPSNDFYTALEIVSGKLKDPLLGLRAGAFMNLKSLGLIYQISLQASTVQEGLFYLKNYVDSTLPIVQINTTLSEEFATIDLSIDSGNMVTNRVLLENTLTVISKELRLMVGNNLKIQIFSPFFEVGYPLEWEKGNRYSIKFANAVLKAALYDRSRWNLDVLVTEYLKMIESLKQAESFSSKVKLAILSLAKPELPALEVVADTFNMTSRTFQRKLSEDNITFRDITLQLKKQISYHLIGHNRFSVNEISDVLGFSEPASFIHSFKKWYGDSPEKYRKKIFF